MTDPVPAPRSRARMAAGTATGLGAGAAIAVPAAHLVVMWWPWSDTMPITPETETHVLTVASWLIAYGLGLIGGLIQIVQSLTTGDR